MCNLNPTRIAPLYDLFGGMAGFADAARAAETISRRELARVTRSHQPLRRGAEAGGPGRRGPECAGTGPAGSRPD